VAVHSILLADDDPYLRRLSEVALRRTGFSITCVEDGADALMMLQDVLPDLVVLDGMMPKVGGLEACRRIKADPRTAEVPVIILSAQGDAADEEAARQAGAAGFIRKPFDAATLGDRIRAICATPAA
jgi:CheY-like chemotaxis protein